VEIIIQTIVGELRAGDVIVVMSNGKFDDLLPRFQAALEGGDAIEGGQL
jgi:UDP-N-acetylmuramate-alanine ligase